MSADAERVVEIKFTPLPGSIESVLNDFVQEQHDRLRQPTFHKYLAIVELLESSLNGYAYEWLSEIEGRRFEKAFEDGDERAFCHLFGPEKIPPHMPSFLYWFMLRKVFASEQLLRAASTVSKRLLKWLAARGEIGKEAVGPAYAVAKAAAHDLPASDQLTRLLGDFSNPNPFAISEAAGGEVIQDLLTIERVESGALWFEGGIGPVDIPPEASELAKRGWKLFAELERSGDQWRLRDHGIVYPEPPAAP